MKQELNRKLAAIWAIDLKRHTDILAEMDEMIEFGGQLGSIYDFYDSVCEAYGELYL